MSGSADEKYLSDEEEVLSAGGGDSENDPSALGKRDRASDESGDDIFDGDGDDLSEGSFKEYSDGSDASGSDASGSGDNEDDPGGDDSDANSNDDDDAVVKVSAKPDEEDIFGDDETPEESEVRKKKKKDKKEKKEKKKRKDKKEKKEKGRDKDKSKKEISVDKPSSKSKRRKLDVERFFLRETEVADEDEFESEEELGEKEEREITQAEAEAIELHRRRMEQTESFQSKTASEIAADILNRYRTEKRSRGEYMGAGGDIMTSEVTHRSLVPGVSDPTIWMIRVKLGMEQQLVRSILFKAFKAKSEGKKVGLKSVFCTASKGYIYLEAFEEVSAREAIMGLSGLYISTFTIVPIGEMTALLNVKVKKKPIKPGQWVRIKRGPLKNDLVKVVSISEGGDSVVIQAVPRIDYSAQPGEKKSKVRPLQAPFEPGRLYGAGHQIARRQFPGTGDMCDFVDNNYYFKGFLLKEVKVDLYINDDNVNPRLEELTMFRKQNGSTRRRGNGDSDDEDDEIGDIGASDEPPKSIVEELAELQAGQTGDGNGEKKVSIYRAGDIVQITGGEYAGLKGRVVAISDTTKLIKLKPLHDQLAMTEMDVEISLVVKYIQPGSHVKVIDGQHVGETGRVVVVNKVDGDHIAAIFTDGIKKEITVNVSHLQMSNEVTIGLNSLEGYELYDFVTLSSNDCGVVVMVGTEQLTVLNPSGVEKTLRPMEIRGKANMQSNRSSSLDNMMNAMRVGDTVTVLEGEHAKKTGTIKHVNKATIWIHCDTYFKHSGIFPVRARSCTLAGASARSQRNDSMSAPTGRGAGRGGAGRGGRGGIRDEIFGKTVKITKGGYKGHIGVVREKTESGYSVELAAKFKVVKVPLDDVIVVGDRHGSLVNRSDNPSGHVFGLVASTPHLLGQTPRVIGGSTPMHAAGSETPLGSYTPRGNETPSSMYGVGSQSPHIYAAPSSPVYQPSGSETPRDNSTPHGTPHGVGGGKKVESVNWDVGMLAVFISGDMIGRQAVLLGRVNLENNMVQVIQQESGRRAGVPMTVPCTQLRLADLVVGGKVVVVSGQNAGVVRTVMGLHRADVFVNDTPGIFKAWQCALTE